MIEIERKFLVNSDAFKEAAYDSYTIKQGFLNRDPERTVRVRITDSHAFLTIKGIASNNGLKRFEWEEEISIKDGEALLGLCEPHIIEKTRYIVKQGLHNFEVDVFHGTHDGLVIAEIELKTENESFVKPDWLSKEVTGQIKYYNSELSKPE